MATVQLERLNKHYPDKKTGGFHAVKGIDLKVESAEFMVLVGPSGCGKSTTLRMVAGLEDITSGTIAIDGRVVNDVLPKDRDIAMVFQNYALYPHMSVYENMAFGLRLRNFPSDQIDRRVREAAQTLGLTHLLDRKPKALSGGQRQRVAVGRAIVRQPKVFLFDEPLSNLDAKMRVEMRTEISKLHRRIATTMIYVTHDQVEAMTMGDRICVMRDGLIMQVDKPLAIYNQPANLFVASFIGSPPMNLLKGVLESDRSGLRFVEANTVRTPVSFPVGQILSARAAAYAGKPIIFGIRPEDVQEGVVQTDEAGASAGVDMVEPMGAETYLHLETGAHTFIARVKGSSAARPGERLQVRFDLSKAHLFDPATEAVLK